MYKSMAGVVAGGSSGVTITSPGSTLDVGGTASAPTLDVADGAITDAKGALAVKPAVTCVASANVTSLSGLPIIDGTQTVDGSIALLPAQTTGSQNGPWVTHAGAWTRPTWYASGSTKQAFSFITTMVRTGTVYQGSTWRMTTTGAITIDTTATTWTLTPVSNAALAQMATLTVKGNNTGGSATPVDLTAAQTKSLLAITASDVSGVAQILAQWGVPVMLQSSGSVGANGALTGITALPAIFAKCFMYFKAGAVASGSAAGMYPVQMSSTSAGTIFNNPLTSGPPIWPASPTAVVDAGPGAYTQTTATDLTLLSLSIAGGTIGANGALRMSTRNIAPNNANAKLAKYYWGGVVAGQVNLTSAPFAGFERMFQNVGVQNQQIGMNITSSVLGTDWTRDGSVPLVFTSDTSAAVTLALTANITTATDYVLCFGGTLELLAAA